MPARQQISSLSFVTLLANRLTLCCGSVPFHPSTTTTEELLDQRCTHHRPQPQPLTHTCAHPPSPLGSREAASAACLLAQLHHSQGAVAERDAVAALHQVLMGRQADAEAEAEACGAAAPAGADGAAAAVLAY